MRTAANVSFLIVSSAYAPAPALTAERAELRASRKRAIADAAHARREAERQRQIDSSLAKLRASFRQA